ncbi:MAG: GNAT family protein [Nitrolancea sp.]
MSESLEENGDQGVVNIVGKRVALGPLRRDSLPLYQRWLNDFVTIRGYDLPAPRTLDRIVGWYERVCTTDRHIMFALYERETMRLIGHTGLLDVDRRHGNAEFDILIGEPECRGLGYGSETTQLIREYAFDRLGFESLYLRVLAFNEAGIRAYRKAGFREAGRLRRHWFVGGRYWDMVYMDCLASDFRGTAVMESN